ncbi:aminoglycoside phosphotransferase family protein [Halomonas daqingensis]|uniref:Aminoglycoside phosphotransferase family protein n=1 Tax=Billgrantia desiderata TaxID=52021 RepID=A0ABS9B1L2_9GAMM|nr:aminoglycoside phosphotransferase family protein [Halomonas desiderata]MCE8041522.1 aminoglycoside phosphotransferase family protein [Halomonas desiderata]MCE8046097.1 aminoglycoside phosphotransferase family protein [Halomonas desiderata]
MAEQGTLTYNPHDRELAARLQTALGLVDASHGVRAVRPMADTGLAHHHLWLSRDDRDWVARIPKQSQLGLAAQANLDYQAACFSRASASGHTPALHAILPPSNELPRGALLVDAIHGRPARLPDDLPAIAEALTAIHSIAVPPADRRPPLQAPDSPWLGMHQELKQQARWLASAGLAPAVRQGIESELSSLPKRLPIESSRLISFDAHPGNFLITEAGQAILVDLEKCRYGLPGFDLAHATLYTSTTWDLSSHTVLEVDDIVRFYRHLHANAGNEPNDNNLMAILLTCRRAMWLWSLTWCAMWRARNGEPQDASTRGEDWSTELSDQTLVAHVRDRVEHYLSPAIIDLVRTELHVLEDRLLA